jgi:hypothetical protein
MFRVTNKSAKRADGFFIFLPDGRRARLSGNFSHLLSSQVFEANKNRILAAGCTVQDLRSSAPEAPVEVPVVAEPVVAPVAVEPSPVVPVEEPVVEPVVDASPEVSVEDSAVSADDSSDAPASSDEKVTRRRRTRAAE